MPTSHPSPSKADHSQSPTLPSNLDPQLGIHSSTPWLPVKWTFCCNSSTRGSFTVFPLVSGGRHKICNGPDSLTASEQLQRVYHRAMHIVYCSLTFCSLELNALNAHNLSNALWPRFSKFANPTPIQLSLDPNPVPTQSPPVTGGHSLLHSH